MLRNVHMSENTWPPAGGRSYIKGFLLSINCMSKISMQSRVKNMFTKSRSNSHQCLWHRFPAQPDVHQLEYVHT